MASTLQDDRCSVPSFGVGNYMVVHADTSFGMDMTESSMITMVL
jgi:hypothetical protein